MEKTELFVCRCHDVSHQLVLETLETEEDEVRVVYGSFHLVHLEFWDKLKSATKYLFGRKRKDGDFDALLLRPEDADRLEWFANFLDRGVSATARLPLLFISHSAATRMCMTWLLKPIKTQSPTEAFRPSTRCRYVCPLSPATSYTDSIAPPNIYPATAPATATSTRLNSCPLMLRSFIV